jgi:hypothetical protein
MAINIRSATSFGMKANAVRQDVVNTAAIIADMNIRLAIEYDEYRKKPIIICIGCQAEWRVELNRGMTSKETVCAT